MSNDNEQNGRAGFHFEDCGEITINDSKSIGYERGFVAKNVQKFSGSNNEAIKEISSQDFDQVKQAILSEVEGMISEARKGNNSTKMQNLVQFLSSVGSASVVEILKAKGILPPV